MRGFYFGVALVCAAAGAYAGGYDDLLRAMAARQADNQDVALAAYSSALAASDLAPAYVPDAYLGRAFVYLRKDRCVDALADLDAALKLRPKFFAAYMARSGAALCLGKKDAALADLNTMVALDPSAGPLRERASFYWNNGQFALAADDYARALPMTVTTTKGYVLLWLAISTGRVSALDRTDFAKKVSDLDLDDWPAPVLDFYRGKASAEQVYRAAAHGDGEVPANQKCEADFYIGEWRLIAKDPTAKALLQDAEKECPHYFVEYSAAREDLKRLP